MIDQKIKILGSLIRMYHDATTDQQRELIVKMTYEFVGGIGNE